jgi:hypothetical protein
MRTIKKRVSGNGELQIQETGPWNCLFDRGDVNLALGGFWLGPYPNRHAVCRLAVDRKIGSHFNVTSQVGRLKPFLARCSLALWHIRSPPRAHSIPDLWQSPRLLTDCGPRSSFATTGPTEPNNCQSTPDQHLEELPRSS